MATGIVAAVAAVATLITTILKFFHARTPEERERARLADEQKKRDEALRENYKAVQKGNTGDTSSIEHRINN